MSDTVVGNLKVNVGMDTAEFVGKSKTFQQQLKILREEMKQLKLSTTEYSRVDKSLTAQMRNNRQQVEVHNKSLQKQEEILKKSSTRIAESKKRIEELNKKKAQGIELTDKEVRKLERLKTSIDSYTPREQRAAEAIARTTTRIKELNKEYFQLAQKRNLQSSGLFNAGKTMHAIGGNLSAIGNGMFRAGQTITQASAIVGAGLIGMIKPAIDFESAFAGIRKTVDDANEADFSRLSKGIRELSKELPISNTELAKIGELAGQLGIKKDSILQFTEVIAKLGMSTNLSTEEGASALAKFANITQMSQDKFDKLGSTIVALGNNFATTESDIVSMSSQLAGAGHSVGLTEAQILSMATALSSVGIEAERGGSTFSKLMVNMKVASETGYQKAIELSKKTGKNMRDLELMSSNNSKGFKKLANSLGMTTTELNKIIKSSNSLQQFSEVAGMTADKFQALFKTNPEKAIASFVDGLANASERGSSAIQILDEMGISEIRLRDTLLRLGGAQKVFNSALELGNKAWSENKALNKEVGERNKTTESQLTLLKNKIVDIAVESGSKLLPAINKMIENSDWLVDSINGVVQGFANMDDGTKELILKLTMLGIAGGPVISMFGNLTSTVGNLAKGGGKVLQWLGKGVALNKTLAETGLATSDIIGKIGLSSKIAMTLTNPWFLALAGGTTVVLGLSHVLSEMTKESRKSAERIRKWGSDVGEELDKTLTKTKKFSNEIGANLNIPYTDTNKLTEPYTKMFNGLREFVDKSSEEMQKRYEKLPEVAQKFAKKEVDARLSHNEEIKAKIEKNEAEILSILSKASSERRQLRIDEKEQIKKLEDEAKQSALSSYYGKANEQLEILKRLSSDLSELDDKTVGKRLQNVKNATKELKRLYDEQVQAVKDALEKGEINAAEYNESMYQLDKKYVQQKREAGIEYYKVAKENLARIQKTIDEARQSGDAESAKNYEGLYDIQLRFAKEHLKELGLTWERMNGVIEENAAEISKTQQFVAKSSETMSKSMVESVKKANAHWNNLMTDKETGRIVRNLNQVIQESIKTEDGWNDLKFSVKYADLSSNAREEIKIAIQSAGRWEELNIEEKAFLASTNAGETLAKFIQYKGEWDSLDLETKEMILKSNLNEEQAQIVATYELWKDTRFMEKIANINTNAPDAQEKFQRAFNEWYKARAQDKDAYFNVHATEAQKVLNDIQNRLGKIKSNYKTTISVEGHISNQAAKIMSGPVFMHHANGTNWHAGGLAYLGDGGRREPFLTPDGIFGISPNTDTLYNLPIGTKVWSSINKFINTTKYDKRLSHLRSLIPKFAKGTTQSFLDDGVIPFNTKTDFLRGNNNTYNVNFSSATPIPNIVINISDIVVREQADINKLAQAIAQKLERQQLTKNKLGGIR